MSHPDTDSNWFADLLMRFAPDHVETDGKTPEEMTREASWKAFTISTAAAIPPGPFGWATILPELLAVTKVQMNLVYRIAAYYGKSTKMNRTLVMLVFSHALGISVGQEVVRRVGSKVMVRSLGPKLLRPMAQRVGVKIGMRLTQKAVARWIPFVLAPIFGAFSKSMTTDIGNEAQRLFAQEIEVDEAVRCPSGHEALAGSKFCPQCGVGLA